MRTMQHDDPAFGRQLRRYRERAGLTQEALAKRAGLTASAISALESGVRRRPYLHTVAALVQALQVSAEGTDNLTPVSRGRSNLCDTRWMQTTTPSLPYKGFRYPQDSISHAVWLYDRLSLSYRDVEELLAERGIIVSYETIRQWSCKFGQSYANQLRGIVNFLTNL